MRSLLAPLSVVGARARRRPARWLAPALGIALAGAFAGAVAAEGAIAGDRSARSTLDSLPPLDRTVRVTSQGVATTGVASQARALLRELGVEAPTEVVMLNLVRLGGTVVQPAAITPLARWVPAAGAARLGPCSARDCPVLLVGGGRVPRILTAAGVRLRVVGSVPLTSAVPLGFEPATAADQPVLVTGDPAGLNALAGLSGIYRTYSWVGPPPTARLHSWQLAAFADRLSRAQASLMAGGSRLSLDGPFSGLEAARAQAAAAPRRLLLSGGGAVVVLALFVVLVGGGLRRDQLAEMERLRAAGAREGQCITFALAESALICSVALAAGVVLAIAASAALARASAEPAGGILTHSLLTPAGALALSGGWVATTAVMTLSALARSPRWIDLLAVAAVSALAAGLVLGTGGGSGPGALIAPLCCVAAGVLIFRAAATVLRAGERAARRGPVIGRLSLIGMARAPALPSLAIAFVAVTVGLGGFALAYRATLLRGAADQAADRVPLDALVSAGTDFKTPLAVASLARWRSLSRGVVLAVRRTDANYTSGAGTVTEPALGVPAGGLTSIHGWRQSDGSAPLKLLAGRLRPPGPVRTPGPTIPPGARWLSLPVSSRALAVALSADLRAPGGAISQLPLGTSAGAGQILRAPVPPGRWELAGLELDEPTGLEISNGHQYAENPVGVTQFSAHLTLGPLLVLAGSKRPLNTVDLRGWRAVGAASNVQRSSTRQLGVSFATIGGAGILRPPQPSDSRPVPVLVDQRTAASVGPGGRLALTIDGLPVPARLVGVLKRFPTLTANAPGFVVADEATLASALDAQLPGQGSADELWISSADPAPLKAVLRAGPLSQLSASFRADLEHRLRTAPTAAGVLATLLAAAALAGVLALLGLLTCMLGAGRDRRLEDDLEAQGIGPGGLRTQVRFRLGLAAVMGVIAGLGVAVLLTTLSVASVRAAGTVANPRPPLVTVVPWVELGIWAGGMTVALCLAGWAATLVLMSNRAARGSASAGVSEAAGALSGGLAR